MSSDHRKYIYIFFVLEDYLEFLLQLQIPKPWSLDPWKHLLLSIGRSDDAEIVRWTLEGNDIWATTLPMSERQASKSSSTLPAGNIDRQSEAVYVSQIKNSEKDHSVPVNLLGKPAIHKEKKWSNNRNHSLYLW